MTLHLYMRHECPECETAYVPYDGTIACPKCGNKEEIEEYPELVQGICESFLYNINSYGDFFPAAWITMDVSDTIQMLFFTVFNKWVKEAQDDWEPHEKTDAFGVFLDDILEKIDFQDQGYMIDYLKRLGRVIYNEFFNVREISFKVEGDKLIQQ